MGMAYINTAISVCVGDDDRYKINEIN